ncbi:MAG: hypothetical protein AB1810_08440 [Pseudomonadota bacterium]
MNKLSAASILVLSGIVAGCGGGENNVGSNDITYTGATNAAAITAENVKSIAESSAEAVYQAVNHEPAGAAASVMMTADGGVQNGDPLAAVSDIVVSDSIDACGQGVSISGEDITISGDHNAPGQGIVISGDNITISGSLDACGQGIMISGGTITVLSSFDAPDGGIIIDTSSAPVSVDSTIATDDVLVFDTGSVSFSELPNNLTTNGGNVSLNHSEDLTLGEGGSLTLPSPILGGKDSQGFISVTSSTLTFVPYRSEDGNTYQLMNPVVSGDGTNGWNVGATFYHPSHGSVNIVASGVKFGCRNHRPSSGVISIEDANGATVSVTFEGCSRYAGSYAIGTGDVSFSGW